MRDVAVIGVGMSQMGELWGMSLRDIWVEAALAAIDDAGVDRIDSLYVGCMSGGLFVGQEHLGALAADYLGMGPLPAARVESACASGGVAVRQAWLDIASGNSDIVLASGVEKMTDVDGNAATFALSTAADSEWEGYNGATFPGLYALMARRHMHEYGTTREQIAMVAVKNHRNGAKNPKAQYPFEITVEGVINSTKVADPLNILDCSPITDGAAGVILCAAELAPKFSKKPLVTITGSGHSTDTIALAQRESLTTIASATRAAEKALKAAGKSPGDIDVAEVHDCFTIAEIIVTESIGFVEKGQGGKAVEAGETDFGGRVVVNPSGGLKSKGHPVGTTGVGQVAEIAQQLWGECGDRQVENARVGLTQNMGGTGASSVVHVLEVK